MFNACLFLSPFGSNYKVRRSNFRNNKWSDLFGMDNLSFSKVKLSINFEICFKVVFEWSNIILVLHTAADCIPNLIMYSQQCSNLSYRQNYCENLNRMHTNYHNPGLRPKPASKSTLLNSTFNCINNNNKFEGNKQEISSNSS